MNSIDSTKKSRIEMHIQQIAELFPHVLTETMDSSGQIKKAIDFNILKQELSDWMVDQDQEKYELTWPGKSEAICLSNTFATQSLRSVPEESVEWDHTQNLYIEGDNLEVLKLLRDSYANQIKCIYIDPPYNTGKEFIYNDTFRFHSDWLSMIYPRLKVARELLREDGVIFISIDTHEYHHLRMVCDEIFGKENYVETFIWTRTSTPPSLSKKSRKTVEFILCYEKKKNNFRYRGPLLENGDAPLLNTGNGLKVLSFPPYSIHFKIDDGLYSKGTYEKVELLDDLIVIDGRNENEIRLCGEFKWTQCKLVEEIEQGTYFLIKSEKFSIRFKRKDDENKRKTPTNYISTQQYEIELNAEVGIGTNETASAELSQFGMEGVFHYSKPTSLIKYLLNFVCGPDDIILDFFSGSAATAEAVMQLNAEDGGERMFIMVQLPEPCSIDSKAYQLAYHTICEIGKERIRRAREKILAKTDLKIDAGFRVYQLV